MCVVIVLQLAAEFFSVPAFFKGRCDVEVAEFWGEAEECCVFTPGEFFGLWCESVWPGVVEFTRAVEEGGFDVGVFGDLADKDGSVVMFFFEFAADLPIGIKADGVQGLRAGLSGVLDQGFQVGDEFFVTRCLVERLTHKGLSCRNDIIYSIMSWMCFGGACTVCTRAVRAGILKRAREFRPVSFMFKISSHLSKEEIRDLLEPSDWRGWLSVATSWGMIVGSLALVAWIPAWWTVLVALIILGGRHLALAILMHEGAHKSLFKTAWMNDTMVQWLCAYPTWNDLVRYREHHLRHHMYTRTEKDPDAILSEPFPVSRASLTRKLLRDLFGVTGVKRVIGIVLMDAGFYTYTISGGAKKIDQAGRTKRDVVKTFVHNTRGFFITNAIFVLVLWSLGHVELYALWVLSYLTTFSLFMRIRSLAEHACTPDAKDPLNNTRTTLANPLARVTVAPHHVNFHLEHHLLMTVPHYHLRWLHALLQERGVLGRACVAPGYVAVLRQVGSLG